MGVAGERPAIYFIQQPPSDVIGHVGGSVSVNCSARSRELGQVKVTWLKDGRDVTEGNDRRSVSESGVLLIAPVMTSQAPAAADDDEGVYECVASDGSVSIISTPVSLHIASQYHYCCCCHG